MSQNRSLLAICIAVCLCIGGVSGCGNDSERVVLEEDDHTAQEKVLRFFAPMDIGSSALYYRELIDQYNRLNKGVRVVYEGISTGDGYNKYLEQRLDAGEGDDVFIVNADMVKTLYNKGYFYDMSEFSAFQQLNESTREQAVIEDTAYCLPVSMTAYCLFVNLDVLNKYNLKPPQNLEEFRNCCRTIKAAGGTPLSLNRWYALTVPALANGLSKMYCSENLQDIRNELNSGALKISDYMKNGFQVVEEFIQEGWYGDGLSSAFVETIKAGDQDLPDFVSGKTAFYFGHLDSLSSAEGIRSDINCVIQGVPVTDGTVTLPAALTRLSINANSKYLEETVEFVNYITSHKYKEVSASGNGVLPIYNDAEYTLKSEKMRPAYETFLKDGQVPIEDMQLHFTYWDTVRELTIKMFVGYSAGEAAEEYDRIQMEQITQYDN